MPTKQSLQEKTFSIDEIVEGIRQGEFFLVGQPQVDLVTAKLFGFEFLARWRHPEYGVVTPNKFIPELESVGQCHLLTAALFKRMMAVVESLKELTSGLHFSLNISASDLDNESLVDELIRVGVDSPVPNASITLEVTESLSILEFNRKASLEKLHAAGFTLAVDDFWTGFSSLETIRTGFFSEIKIDFSLTSQLINDATSMAGVNAIVQLSKDLDMHCVVEGIETPLVQSVLIEAGARIGQGYLFGAGVADDVLGDWIVEDSEKQIRLDTELPVIETLSSEEAEFLDTRKHPSWAWDFDEKKVVWANIEGLKFWEADSVEELRSRDMSNMGYTIETRLESYRKRFESGEKEISAVWSLYPNKIPKTVFCIQLPRIDEKSGHLLLLINAFEGFKSRLNDKKYIDDTETIPVPFMIATECGILRSVNRHAHVELGIEPNFISEYFSDKVFLAMKQACDNGSYYERFVDLKSGGQIKKVYLRAVKTYDKSQQGLSNYHVVAYPVPEYYSNRVEDYR